MAEERLIGMAKKIKEFLPEAEIKEADGNVILLAEHEIGIKGVNINIECKTGTVKIKGSREYKYPISEAAAEEFQDEMLQTYPDYSIYLSGQVLSFSKFFSYQNEDDALEVIKNAITAMEEAVLSFENDCVNFMEKEPSGKDTDKEYNPEENINLVNVDNSYHAVTATAQDNEEYDNVHKSYAQETFDKLAKDMGATKDGNEFSVTEENNETIRCVIFPLDAEILVSVSVKTDRDIGAMYASYINSNYPELMSSYDTEKEIFSVRTYSTPDEYEPDGTENLLKMCKAALDACIKEYKQTIEKKDSVDFASDVQQILVEQTESISEREKAVAAREDEMSAREEEMEKRENELKQHVAELEQEKIQLQEEAAKERERLKAHEAEMEEKIKAYEERNTKDVLNIQQLAAQVAALQNRQSVLGQGNDNAEEEIFRMKSKVQQLTSQKIALEKKLTEKLTVKDTKLKELSDTLSQKDVEYKKLENNMHDMVQSQVAEESKKTNKKIQDLEDELTNMGHFLTPEEMIEYLKEYSDAEITKRHAAKAEFVVYEDEALEIRIRFGDVNYIDVSRTATLKDQMLCKLNSKHAAIKFFSKDTKIVARAYFKKNATAEEVDDLTETLASYFTK